ncbi:hypothetical protein [Niveispirillum sp. BGYR6]|uniref:YciI family protein n=1 Tax=Niveispirillum sp. BGYR6 TaxID=2971249 RepID=UPI0022B99481|nr:hypothetical protein [Niveispirillum sp. BGYR6]MDG5494650.1 hypothetical protein [Niveispirillum sp. BGYR6]
MHIVFLRFTADKARASHFMAAHNEWLQRGFTDGVFLLAGSLGPGLGGAILADGEPLTALEARVAADPFVVEGIVSADISTIVPGRTDPRLDFLRP